MIEKHLQLQLMENTHLSTKGAVETLVCIVETHYDITSILKAGYI